MSNAAVTRHARDRMVQRAVPAFVLDLLHRFGSSFRSHGADRLIFDKAARRRIEGCLGAEGGRRTIEPWLGVYAVIADDGTLITTAHQTKRQRRKINRRWSRRGR